MTWERFLFELGKEYNDEEIFDNIFDHIDYFKLAHKNGATASMALEHFNYYLAGENVFD